MTTEEAPASSCWRPWIVVWLLQLVPLAFILIDVPIRLLYGARVEWPELLGHVPVLAYAVLVGSMGGTLRGRRWLCGHWKQLLLGASAMVVAYLLCEPVATLLALRGGLGQRGKSHIVYENAGQTIRFDAIRGYRLGPIPSRYARITDGTLEYVGRVRGNNEGFPDRDDVHPQRPSVPRRRLAVFGDSFTAAQFLERSWPDRCEDLTRESSEPLELLNFSIDGGGLANWWSVLTRIVQPKGYQIDGVVFAVFSGDLRRGFSITEYHGQQQPMFARVPCWDPRRFPSTPEEAEAFYEPWDARIVSEKEFDAFLRGQWKPRPPVPFVARMLWQNILRPELRSTQMSLRGIVDIESERQARIEEIRRVLETMSVPSLVVSIPTKDELLQRGAAVEVDADTRDFAQRIGAQCLNGGSAFVGRTAAQIRSDWLPYDGHWGQGGSDRFAELMVGVLTRWQAKTNVQAAAMAPEASP